MPNIDTLSVQFNANGTDKAVKNIKAMGYAVRNLAQSVKSIDSSKLGAFTSSMETLKKSIPTEAQTNRMTAFSNAVKELSGAIGSSNISSFSRDMSTLGDAVNTFKKSSVNSITNAVTAMQNLQAQTQTTANVISNAIPKKSADIKMGDNKATLNQTREVIAGLDKAGSRVQAIKSAFKGIYVPTKQFKSLEEQSEKIAQKFEKLRQKMQEALDSGKMTTSDEAFKKQSAELDALRQQYNDLILKQKELAQSGGGIVLNPTLKSSLDAFHKGFSRVTNVIKNGFVAGIRHANSVIKSFASHIKQSATSLKNTVTGGHKATDMAKNFAKELLRVSKMLKLMVTRMALRAVIKEVGNGFKSLALHSEEFNNSMSSLMNGSKKLGYSFAAMVSPLINALAPAIVYVINLLTKLINIIQQVFGALTGATTWNKAKDFTESWADNINEANKGAKELKKTVLGFDELNQLQEKSSGGSGNGITDMFDTMQIDPKWKEFADWLKDMWKMGDFTELGKKLGEGLRDFLESIPWDKIRDTSHKLGESLATLINGFVEVERLGYDIGKTIAQSINTVFEFLNGFVHKLHWDSIGKFIAETFNGFFENIDWVLIKDTVVTGMAGIAEAIQNFIDTFHWDNISTFIINAVDTIVSGVLAFIDGIDWLDLGKKIGTQIRKTIEGINWYDVGQAIGGIIQAAVDWVSGMLDTMPSVETLIQKATDLLHGLFDRVDPEEMGANIGKIMQGVYDFLVGFWKENGEDIKNEVKKFFKGIWDNIDKKDLMKVLGNILLVASLGGIASVGWKLVKQKFAEKFLGAITAKALQSAVSKGVAEATAKGVTEAAGSEMIGTATATAGASVGSMLVAGITSYLVGHEVGNSIGKALFPEDEELYDQYSGITGIFRELKDVAVGAGYAIKEAFTDDGQIHKLWESLEEGDQKLFTVLKVHYGTEFPNYIDQNIDKFGSWEAAWSHLKEEASKYSEETQKKLDALKKEAEKSKDSIGKIYDTKAAEAMSKMNQQTETLKTSLSHIADTKAAEGLKKMKESAEFETLKKGAEDFEKALDNTKTTVNTAADSINKDWKGTQEEVTNSVTEMTKSTDTLSESVDTMSQNVKKSIEEASGIVSENTEKMIKSFDSIKEGMTKEKWTFNGVAEGLTETFRKAKEGIKGQWNQIASTLNGEHKVGTESIKINLPKFATGGFPEDGLFMANHHELVGSFSNGKTAVANNGQIIAGIETGVYAAVSKALDQNNNGSQYISNEIIVDGDVIARSVSKAQERQGRRFSPSMA